jgi:L-iditol 2-dehydrogenase
MLAAVYHDPNDLRLEERAMPEIAPDEILLKIETASICGTDLRILHGTHRKFPPGTVRIPGHEIFGEIAGLGKAILGYEVGQKVFVAPNIGCGHCRQCIRGRTNLCRAYDAFGITLDGAFAQYMRVTAPAIRQGNVIALNTGINPLVAPLIEPLACALHGQDAVSIRPGNIVLIMGAGPIGIMHLLLAKLHGATRLIVSEVAPERVVKAQEFRPDRVVNPQEENLPDIIRQETGGRGADVVLVAAASAAAQQEALRLAGLGGRINLFGGLPNEQSQVQFDSNLIHYKELRVTGTTGSSTGDCRRALEIVQAGHIDLERLVGASFPLLRASEAFRAAQERQALKVVLQIDL